MTTTASAAMPEQATKAAAAAVATMAMPAAAATTATMTTKGVRLRLQANQGDGHDRQTQH